MHHVSLEHCPKGHLEDSRGLGNPINTRDTEGDSRVKLFIAVKQAQ